MTTYELGTIATATVRGMPGVRVMRHSSHGWFSGDLIGGEPGRFGEWRTHGDSDVTDVRPLVVLDLGALPVRPTSSWRAVLRKWEQEAREAGYQVDARVLAGIADQIEAQTRPSITEPTGLGAVVEDSDGVRWVRIDSDPELNKPWRNANLPALQSHWKLVNAVRVLSEGVHP